MAWHYLSIPKLQQCYRWSLGMDKYHHRTLYFACDYSSVLEFKSIHVSKRGPWHIYWGYCWHRVLSYYSDMTLSQSVQPMGAQLSKKAVLPLAKILTTASCRNSKTGPRSHLIPFDHLKIYSLIYYLPIFLNAITGEQPGGWIFLNAFLWSKSLNSHSYLNELCFKWVHLAIIQRWFG